ncbi:YajQ family cyclic di-GMP-binding protein [Candidatus Peregrinibacteria bacterium]|nr:YajQ family cyclic di-GMP-binding protein [Candidatus Peregrinibacteria bacterium]
MASEYSFDVVAQFDLQEVRNAVDQVKREITTRYDFRDVKASVELGDEMITIIAPGEMKVKQVYDVLLQKIINRKQSPKIIDAQEAKPTGGMDFKQEIKLVKVLSQEKCKEISALIKEGGFKVKPSINGNAVRVSSKDKDELQAVMKFLTGKEEQVGMPLMFENLR